MSATAQTEKTIFLAAAEIAAANDRAAFIDQACAGDLQLRAAVDALLHSHQQSLGLLDATATPHAQNLGTMIGPYKLLQQLGEGGMGVVYMAEQTEPIARRVALKIIKPGMDTRQVIARFEAERQALALMDHANIARVLDAGTTEQGRPYFVMELVHGVPITLYCDDQRLTPRQRLELFVPVCQAIQHAHQKGVIHRDIKPTNVMVTLYDGKPVPKVIDFGVAKATEQKLTERTLFTQYGTMVGTLEYMSPEQAEMSALGVDTRSDIYSLGVLLYELLTGNTPLTHKQMKEAAYAEILRMIKEEEPPKPSTRLSESGEALATISANRHTEPAKLSKLMHGELDWIVMKTLEKDRNRRYETASGFAADVQCYLNDEPVQACPPSVGYRFRKFARRNKAALAAASVAALVVLLAMVGLAVSNILIAREKDHTAAALDQSQKNEQAYKEQLRRTDNALHVAIGATDNYFQIPYDSFTYYDEQDIHSLLLPQEARALRETRAIYRRLITTGGDLQYAGFGTVEAYNRAAFVEGGLGQFMEAEATIRAAIPALDRLALEHPGVADYPTELADSYLYLGRALEKTRQTDEAERAFREAIRLAGDLLASRRQFQIAGLWTLPSEVYYHQQLAYGYNDLGRILYRTGRPRDAETAYRQALIWVDRHQRGHWHLPNTEEALSRPHAMSGLAQVLQAAGRTREAEEAYRGVCGFWDKVLTAVPGDRHFLWNRAAATARLGDFLRETGRARDAGEEYRRALKIWEDLVTAYPTVPAYPRQLAWFLTAGPVPELRNPARAVMVARKASELAPADGNNWTTLAAAHYRTGNWGEAQAALDKATGLRPWGEGLDWFLLALVRWQEGDKDGALQWYEKAVAWTAKNDVYNDDLRRFRTEAAELLGVKPRTDK